MTIKFDHRYPDPIFHVERPEEREITEILVNDIKWMARGDFGVKYRQDMRRAAYNYSRDNHFCDVAIRSDVDLYVWDVVWALQIK